MRFYVGVTDNDWFRFLRSQPEVDEVNFWQPSGKRRFRVLQAYEPFLFKLHSPQNFIVGGGYFVEYWPVPASLAWETFGIKNGAATFAQMRQRIEKYRRVSPDRREDYQIGCIVLTQPFFFPETDWIPVPKDWSLNIVQGKGYDTSQQPGRELWAEVQLRIAAQGSAILADEVAEQPSVYGEPVLVRPRLGQGGFRVVITENYERRCAVTQERALPVLEAAHILPVSDGGLHKPDNGLLLRSDLHRLYDAGYVTITPDHRFRVSRKLKADFDNGEPYYPLDHQEIWRPNDTRLWPNRHLLERHADLVFRG